MYWKMKKITKLNFFFLKKKTMFNHEMEKKNPKIKLKITLVQAI